MSQHDPISVRTTRLNNLILGRRSTSANGAVGAKPGRRSVGVGAFHPAVVEALQRESLLDAFCVLYNECDKDALKKRDKNIAEFVKRYRPIVEETKQLRVNPHDFAMKAVIGKGYFGNVHLVVEKPTSDVYAMKKIKKSVVTCSQVKVERDIMSQRSSEWITHLQYAFQDNENLYLIMEFLPGGDLLGLMMRQGPFDEEWTRFYLAELTMAINALHSMGYIHRDIKPENILIDRFGHIKLADFGNAAAMDRDGHVMSLSPVGTPDYIAPELLQTISSYKLTKSMHDVSCDFWSMGIIGYELICEVTPFHEDSVHETYSKILSHCEESHLKEIIAFPNDLRLSNNYKDLILSLVTNPSNRLSYTQIRKHAFFETIKWDSLRAQVPPIIPNVQNEEDTSNFEDISRHKKGRPGVPAKKSLSMNVKSNEFSGKDLPFIGYTFVHMEQAQAGSDEVSTTAASGESRSSKLNGKVKELQTQLKERVEEISVLKQKLLRAEQTAKQSDSQSKMLQDARDDISKLKNIIKDKTAALAACKTQIKTLQSCVQTEQEMWAQKEASITELLRMNRQKYEDARTTSELRYERVIAEKKQELAAAMDSLEAQKSKLTAKNEECTHLLEKVENYKELLRQFKEKAQADRQEFEKTKTQLTDTFEQKLAELRSRLRKEKDSHSLVSMELREVRHELNDSISCSKSSQEARKAIDKSNDDILRRLNQEIESNNTLHAENVQLQQLLADAQKATQSCEQEIQRLERELKVVECSKNLAESALATESPYETAPGSLTELHAKEEQLRVDLETAIENENAQRERADKLQGIVAKLEEMMDRFNEQASSISPTKPHPAPRHAANGKDCVGDMLERQNEKLEDKLAAVREQMIVERQAARTANLALWKVEKKLEETLAEKKMTQRRMELTEERIKKVQGERDEAQRLHREAQEQSRQKEDRIRELRDEIAALKQEVLKEHRMWEKAEQERMQSKSEIIDHISSVHKLEERVAELTQKLQQTQAKCDTLTFENKRQIRELDEEREKNSAAADKIAEDQIQIKNLQANFEHLKYACTITDNQLTEVETMLEAEQKRNASQQEKIDKLYASLGKKDESISHLRKELSEMRSQKIDCDTRLKSLQEERDEYRMHLQELQKKLVSQQQQLVEQTKNYFSAQERIEVLTTDATQLQTLNSNHEREINLLKEENARILSELFHAKEDAHNLQEKLKEALAKAADLGGEVEELQAELAEKQNFYLQREIKSEATLTQHKKLIDYLQLKVEDLSQKKAKKTLADVLFFGHNTSTGKKENISPIAVEQSILYRTLQEELRREKLHCKKLQEQIDQLTGVDVVGKANRSFRVISKEKSAEEKQDDAVHSEPNAAAKVSAAQPEEPQTKSSHSAKRSIQAHRFQLSLLEAGTDNANCAACQRHILVGSPYWKCRECKAVAHRKCRSDVRTECGSVGAVIAPATEPSAPEITAIESDPDTDSQGSSKYLYEGKVDDCPAPKENKSDDADDSDYVGTLVFAVNWTVVGSEPLEVNCAYEVEEQKVLLLGCNIGLYAYHLDTKQLVHIAGIDAVNYIAISLPLAKAILVGSHGESLYQCDYRHLHSRSHASACLKPALEASVLDLPFANRAANEKWQLVKISNEAEDALDSVAIAATSTRIVILKYDMKMQKFKPVRALDTATSVSAIVFTRHTAIVTSDKFFEIDLSSYAAEEFVDISDQSLSHTSACQPLVAIRFSRQEFLLCFTECGIFVDQYGCRSRPYDLSWDYTPTGFLYREPFLYISHFQSVQIMRLHRSYSKEVASIGHRDSETDVDRHAEALKRVYLSLNMPTLLAESGRLNAFALNIQKDSGLQEIYHLDAVEAFRNKHNDSMETISSVATTTTLGSECTADNVS